MSYVSVSDISKKWGISERTIRNYCALGKIPDAFLTGKTWNIPENAKRPDRINKRLPTTLLEILQAEKDRRLSGGIYHKVQIELTYNSNHIEGSKLTHDQTRYIFETNTIGLENQVVNVDDIIETSNHFRCIDITISNANHILSEKFIKQIHTVLKSGTSDARNSWFTVGDYKKLPNEVGGMTTTSPEDVPKQIKTLLSTHPRKRIYKILSTFTYNLKGFTLFRMETDESGGLSSLKNVSEMTLFLSLLVKT